MRAFRDFDNSYLRELFYNKVIEEYNNGAIIIQQVIAFKEMLGGVIALISSNFDFNIENPRNELE